MFLKGGGGTLAGGAFGPLLGDFDDLAAGAEVNHRLVAAGVEDGDDSLRDVVTPELAPGSRLRAAFRDRRGVPAVAHPDDEEAGGLFVGPGPCSATASPRRREASRPRPCHRRSQMPPEPASTGCSPSVFPAIITGSPGGSNTPLPFRSTKIGLVIAIGTTSGSMMSTIGGGTGRVLMLDGIFGPASTMK